MPPADTARPTVLHRDTDLLVVAKPPGLPTTSPDSSQRSLTSWAKSELPGRRRVHPTSRLDAPVSGVVTFALTSRANQHLLAARRAGCYRRDYVGITASDPRFDEDVWNWPISVDPADRRQRVAGPGRGERDARTRCSIAARVGPATLLRLEPETGRTHQLRVHAARAGVPLLGDPHYRGERRVVLSNGAVVRARRVMLHCLRVCFPLLDGDRLFEFEAPVPRDMEEVWVALGGLVSQLRLEG